MKKYNAQDFWMRYEQLAPKDLPVLIKTGIAQSTMSCWKKRTTSNYFFDIKDFILMVSKYSENDYINTLNLYNKILPYYMRTSRIFDVLELAGTFGLSVYIPNDLENRSELHEYYKTLSWTQDSQSFILFD